jgi:phosphohistidine phosphatase
MKILYLVRHAKSSWNDPEMDDFDRPLNGRGEKNAPEMAKRLKRKRVKPDLMISSPANRALTTAKLMAKELGYSEKDIEEIPSLYHASENSILRIVQTIDDHSDSVMIFGHNPGMTYFANMLCKNYRIENIPTAGVFSVRFNVISWKEASAENCELIFFDYPKNSESR